MPKQISTGKCSGKYSNTINTGLQTGVPEVSFSTSRFNGLSNTVS